jgi:hypothetical protein
MSQPPPWDKAQSSNQDEPPSRPSGTQRPAWLSGGPGQGQPPSWPSGGPDQGQPPSGGSGQDQPPAWPSPGQPPPPSWPAGAPGQPPPASWPPGGQPPYPGPGHSYGYGPRPPRFRRRHPFRGAIIALVLFIVFGFVVRNLTATHSTVSITPFPSVSGSLATRHQPPGVIGSQFDLSDGSGNVYRVTLVKVVDPAKGADQFSTPDGGKRFVGLIFRLKALTGSPQNEDADNDAVVVGGNGQTYSADFAAIAGYTNFNGGAIHLAQGETMTGSVTFQVPDGVPVSRVQWTALSGFGSTVEWTVHG